MIYHSASSFSAEANEKYYKDPRWKEATKLTKQCRFEACNKLVLKIQMDHDRIK